MSLEQQIAELNKSVAGLSGLITQLIEVMSPVEITGRTLEQDIEMHDMAKPEPVAESIAAGEEQAPATLETEQVEEKTITADDLKAQFVALVNAKGSAAMHTILKDFHATKLSGIKPEQYVEVAEAIETAMGAK